MPRSGRWPWPMVRAAFAAPLGSRSALNFVQKAQAVDRKVRREMIEPSNPDLSIGKRCRLLSISRSSFYYRPKGETALNVAHMRQIDEQFLETPFFGVRQMTCHLRNEEHLVNGEVIYSLREAQILIEQWREHYNTKRPHSALGYRPPAP